MPRNAFPHGQIDLPQNRNTPMNPPLAYPLANRLVELCRKGQFIEAIQETYSKDVVSVEAFAGPGQPSRAGHGLDHVLAKGKWWTENHTVHSSKVEGPFMHGDDRFAVYFEFDVTAKFEPMSGKRFMMKEVGIYTVQGGKVVHEDFYYTMH